MTYRELLQSLSSLSNEQLDMDVLLVSDYQPSIDLDESGVVENELSFRVAKNDMYRVPQPSGPCGMGWDGESYLPAAEADEELVTPDFIKCYNAGTPYISIKTV